MTTEQSGALTALATVVLVVVTAAYAVITSNMARQTRETAKAGRDAARVSLLAYVLSAQPFLSMMVVDVSLDARGRLVKLVLGITNVGSGAAHGLAVTARAAGSTLEVTPARRDVLDVNEKLLVEVTGPGGATIGIGGSDAAFQLDVNVAMRDRFDLPSSVRFAVNGTGAWTRQPTMVASRYLGGRSLQSELEKLAGDLLLSLDAEDGTGSSEGRR